MLESGGGKNRPNECVFSVYLWKTIHYPRAFTTAMQLSILYLREYLLVKVNAENINNKLINYSQFYYRYWNKIKTNIDTNKLETGNISHIKYTNW